MRKGLDVEIEKILSNYDKTTVPEDLAKINDFANDLYKNGKMKRKESQLFPNEAFCYLCNINNL